MDKNKPIIKFKNVNKEYDGGLMGLDNVTLEIAPGEFVFLIGSSGAGKTTLMKHIVKEEVPTSGEIHIDGEDLSTIKSNKIPYLRRKTKTGRSQIKRCIPRSRLGKPSQIIRFTAL